MIAWQAIGKHRFRIEGDLVFIEWHGAIGLPEMQVAYGLLTPIYAEYGRAFFLSDLRDSDLPTAPVRSWIAEWQRTHQELSGGAAFGAGLAARSMFLLLTRALALVSKRQLPSALFATEAQARTWLDELRLKVAQSSR